MQISQNTLAYKRIHTYHNNRVKVALKLNLILLRNFCKSPADFFDSGAVSSLLLLLAPVSTPAFTSIKFWITCNFFSLSCTRLNLAILWTNFKAFSFLPLQSNHLRDSGMRPKKSAKMTRKLGKVAMAKRALHEDKYMDMTGVKMEESE